MNKIAEKRAELAKKIKKMIDLSESEDRGFNETEKSQFDKLRAEIKDLDERKANIESARMAHFGHQADQ